MAIFDVFEDLVKKGVETVKENTEKDKGKKDIVEKGKEFFKKTLKYHKSSELINAFIFVFLFLPLFLFGVYYVVSKWGEMTKRVAWLTILFFIFAIFANTNNGLFLIIALVIIRFRDNIDIAMGNIFEKKN